MILLFFPSESNAIGVWGEKGLIGFRSYAPHLVIYFSYMYMWLKMCFYCDWFSQSIMIDLNHERILKGDLFLGSSKRKYI